MALTKQKKHEVVAAVAELLAASKMTVVAAYPHTTVKAMQQLKRAGRANGTTLRVIKNRLVIKALAQVGSLQATDTAHLKGQLVYAFNSEDEVAPAQVIAAFAKTNPTLDFVGAISAGGVFLSAEEVKSLATLPGKNELIALTVATLSSPLDQVMNGLSGNLHALLDGLATKATA
jgi:large subunit ribosomal protein L10